MEQIFSWNAGNPEVTSTIEFSVNAIKGKDVISCCKDWMHMSWKSILRFGRENDFRSGVFIHASNLVSIFPEIKDVKRSILPCVTEERFSGLSSSSIHKTTRLGSCSIIENAVGIKSPLLRITWRQSPSLWCKSKLKSGNDNRSKRLSDNSGMSRPGFLIDLSTFIGYLSTTVRSTLLGWTLKL